MRYFTIVAFLLCTYTYTGMAQPAGMLNKPYRERYKLLDSISKYAEKESFAVAIDKLKGLQKWADLHNDKELATEFLLMQYIRALTDGGNDAYPPERLQELGIEAHKNKFYYLEAKIAQTAGDYYGNVKKKNAQAFENFLAAYSI